MGISWMNIEKPPWRKHNSEHFSTTHTHKVIQNSHSIPHLQTHTKLNNRLAFTNWDTYISSVVGSLLSVVCVMAVACSAIVEGVWTRCRQQDNTKQPWLFLSSKELVKNYNSGSVLGAHWSAYRMGSHLRKTCWRGRQEWCRPQSPCGSRSPPCESGLGCWAPHFPPGHTAVSCLDCSALHTHYQSLEGGHTWCFTENAMDTNISVTMSNTQTFTYSSCLLTTQWYHVRAIFYREAVTFKGLCCSGCMIFVWMELQRKFPVGFFELFITNFFVDAQHFIVILTPLYSEGQKNEKSVKHVVYLFKV